MYEFYKHSVLANGFSKSEAACGWHPAYTIVSGATLLATKLLVPYIGESQEPGPFGRSGIGLCPVRVGIRSGSRQQSVNMV